MNPKNPPGPPEGWEDITDFEGAWDGQHDENGFPILRADAHVVPPSLRATIQTEKVDLDAVILSYLADDGEAEPPALESEPDSLTEREDALRDLGRQLKGLAKFNAKMNASIEAAEERLSAGKRPAKRRTRTVQQAERGFRIAELFLSKRVCGEEISEALDVINRLKREGASPWRIWLKFVSTCFWLAVNSIRHVSSALQGKKAE
jgi:hypothetical protein